MPRRSTVERIFTEQQAAVAAPGSVLLSPASGIVVDPRSVVLAAGGGAVQAELQSNGVTFLHLDVPAGSSQPIYFPEGLELAIGSGVELVTDAAVDVTFYYCLHDENPGITKVASRAASFSNVTVTRTPNQYGEDAKT